MSLTAKLLLTPLLVAQALHTRARLPRLPEPEGARQGAVGRGPVLSVLIAGDSSAVGVGVVHQRDALAAQFAAALAARCGARVQWRLAARSGLTSAQTLQLLQRETLPPIDLALVVSGVNDVVDQVPSHRAVAAREALANWLRNGLGALHVVFAPLPPVHRFPLLPQPLRRVMGDDARRHDDALAAWAAARAGVSHLAIAFDLSPAAMASDGFHPGAPVYRVCGETIAAHIADFVSKETSP